VPERYKLGSIACPSGILVALDGAYLPISLLRQLPGPGGSAWVDPWGFFIERRIGQGL